MTVERLLSSVTSYMLLQWPLLLCVCSASVAVQRRLPSPDRLSDEATKQQGPHAFSIQSKDAIRSEDVVMLSPSSNLAVQLDNKFLNALYIFSSFFRSTKSFGKRGQKCCFRGEISSFWSLVSGTNRCHDRDPASMNYVPITSRYPLCTCMISTHLCKIMMGKMILQNNLALSCRLCHLI